MENTMIEDEKNKFFDNLERIPASDDNGLRKTFATPELEGVKEIHKKTKYPWSTIKVGESFEIMYSEMKISSVAPYVSKMAKKHKKKLKLLDCPQYRCYLISCLPMTEEQASQTSNNVVEALDKVALKSSLFEALDKMKEGG